jgi:ribose transport system substrate-binding protein
VDAVKNGEFVATITSDPFWQGGMGLSIGYHAAMKTFDPAKEPHDHREFYGRTTTITKDTVDDYIKTNVLTHPVIDWNDLWGRVTGPIRAS